MILFPKYCRSIIVSVVVFGCLFPLNSQTWRMTGGPEGGEISALVMHNNALFAGTNSGIWKSADEGKSWQYISVAAQITHLCSIGRYLFAVTYSDGVLRSGNDGVTWDVVKVPIDPDRSVNMIGAALGIIITGATAGNATLFISSDTGTTWNDLNTQSGFPQLTGCTSIESIGSYLFLCSQGSGSYGGIIRSSDTGKTWERANNGLNLNIGNFRALGRVDSVLLCAGVERNTDEGCIFISRDKGAIWSKSQAGLPESCLKRVNAFGICSRRVFAAVHEYTIPSYIPDRNYIYKSDDFGTTWQRLEAGLAVTDGNCFLSLPGRLMLGLKCGGIYEITENDSTWLSANNGLRCMPISAICTTGDKLLCSVFYHFVFEFDANNR
jgi:photosystem II stability/assembly factor-like uncharacterized protein